MKEAKKITARQAHTTLGLSKRLTDWVEKRFAGRKESLDDWKKIFKKEIKK